MPGGDPQERVYAALVRRPRIGARRVQDAGLRSARRGRTVRRRRCRICGRERAATPAPHRHHLLPDLRRQRHHRHRDRPRWRAAATACTSSATSVPGRLDPARAERLLPPRRGRATTRCSSTRPTRWRSTSKIVEVARRERLDLLHAHYAMPHATSAYLARADPGADGGARRRSRHHAARHRHHAGRQRSVLPAAHPLLDRRQRRGDRRRRRWLARGDPRELDVRTRSPIEVIPNFVDTRPLPTAPARRAPGVPRTAGASCTSRTSAR